MVIVAISLSVMIENGMLAFIGPSFFSLPFSQGRSFHLGAMVFTTVQLVIIGLSVATMPRRPRAPQLHEDRQGDAGDSSRRRAGQGLPELRRPASLTSDG